MMDALREMWSQLEAIFARQELESPDFYAPYLTQAQRTALMALAGFTVLAVVLFAFALAGWLRGKRGRGAKERMLALGGTLGVCLGLCAWAYWPMPVVPDLQAVSAIEVRTRVPGKAEKTLELTAEQQQRFLEAVASAQCRRGWADELPYAGYGQTFRIFLTTEQGTVCLYMAPEEGCRYTQEDNALIYPLADYEAFYGSLRQLAAEVAPQLVQY